MLLVNPFYLPAQQTAVVNMESGVSESLANYRSRVLSQVHYALEFKIPQTKGDAIEAQETISFNWKKNDQSLPVDFKYGSSVHQLKVNDKIITVRYKEEHLLIDAAYLQPGSNTIQLQFTAGELSLNRNPDFLYTLLVPDRARTVFPCFDQPNIKAQFRLTLNLPLSWKALSNAPLLDSSLQGDRKIYHYKESDRFSTYLFSFVAGRFTEATQQAGDRMMQFYYRETDSTKIRLSVDSIFKWHRTALQYMEDYTQISFPFQKLDFAAIPAFQYGGMEHVGAIDYNAATLFLDSSATKDQQNARSNVIAHETAHMWFGDLVTMQWFNDVWMKEVFAGFMADKITQGGAGNNNYELKFLLTHYPRAYAVDRTAGATPIRQPLSNLREAGTLYGPIIYDKAPVMMRQLERLMGATAFRDGLREYLKKYRSGNATWPDLIRILDQHTPADLQSWNQVWVNTPGRPILTYSLQQKEGIVSRLSLHQRGERSDNYVLPQFLELALVYPDRIEEVTVNMNKTDVDVKEIRGKRLPSYILFNSSGQGYGVFPVDKGMTSLDRLQNPVMRGSAYINAYENMLNGETGAPAELLETFLKIVQQGGEKEELNLSLLCGYITGIYWHFLPLSKRQKMTPELEASFWKAMEQETVTNKKKILFKSFQSIALSKKALDSLYHIWKGKQPPQDVKLSEEDYTSLGVDLTVKEYADTTVLSEQLSRISNPDRRQRLAFVRPSLSSDENIRDQFFESLKDSSIRKKESWVAEALAYLHHPLRTATSIKYVKESLDMLQEIQRTNDIFFPSAWLNATLGNYKSKEAADIVRNFLQSHTDYNPKLKAKILQAADPLFRAERLVKE